MIKSFQMQTKESESRLSNMLWSRAKFITSKEYSGKRVSLYLMNKEYYTIWYSQNDFENVDKVEQVTLSRAGDIFGKIF
jgi:hypothetical protein